MRVFGAELLKTTRETIKFILNDDGIIFFLASQQHRDLKVGGLSYEDDYRGNALAGLVTADHVEIRFHREFTDDRVRRIWSRILAIPELADTRLGKVFYQGREIL